MLINCLKTEIAHKVINLRNFSSRIKNKIIYQTDEKLRENNNYNYVIIGGGILGSSTAYHLSKKNPSSKICLLEKEQIACGQTSKSAGVIIVNSHKHLLGRQLAKQTIADLKEFTGNDQKKDLIDYFNVGSLKIKPIEKNLGNAQKSKKKSSISHLKSKSLNKKERKSLETALSGENHIDGFFALPEDKWELSHLEKEDGFIDPYQLTRCYLTMAKEFSALSGGKLKIKQNSSVMAINKNEYDLPLFQVITQKKKGINTSGEGSELMTIYAEKVINTSGYKCMQFVEGADNSLSKKKIAPQIKPFANLRSHFWCLRSRTVNMSRKIPVLLFPGGYLKAFNHDLEIGIQEKQSLVVDNELNIPEANEDLLLEKYDFLKSIFPLLDEYELCDYICGISTYTPDGLPVIIESSRKKNQIKSQSTFSEHQNPPDNIVTISGCNGYGISWAGGIGKCIAEENYKGLEVDRFRNIGTSEDIEKMACARRSQKFR